MVKYTHDVILILVSSKCLIPYSGGSSKNSWFKCFILSWSSKICQLYHHEDSSKSLQGFTLCFSTSFIFIILLLPEFFMEALHGGSSRLSFILHLFFKISLGVNVGERCRKQKNFLRFHQDHLGVHLATSHWMHLHTFVDRERKRSKNGVDVVEHDVIQITDDQAPNGRHLRVQHTYGTGDVSSFLIQQGGRRG